MNEVHQTIARIESSPAPETVPSDRSGAGRIRVIEPGRRSLSHLAGELWRYRETLYYLTWRDIKVKYKQTALGALWAVLQPVLTMAVMSMVFGRFAHLSRFTGGVPFPVFVFSGLLPWLFFVNSLNGSSNSVVSNSSLVTKVRFPRLTLPIASVLGALVDLSIGFLVLIALLLIYHITITPRILCFPILVMGVAGISLGIGALTAALSVTYRDFKYVIPLMTQLWMYLTPIMYPANLVPQRLRLIYSLNPLTGWINGFRSILIGGPIPWHQMAISAGVMVVLLCCGISYFLRVERRFVDII
jgi:lipopolysaccharide transport system permease protein